MEENNCVNDGVGLLDTECPYQMETSQELGRYLIAARDIQPREIIIQEDPFISGPSDGKWDIPLCLGCCSRLCQEDSLCNLCSKCYWPVCSQQCEKATCHSENECEIFSRHKVIYPPPHKKPILNKSIIILRCLQLKKKNPKAWAQLMTMEDHHETRKNTPNCCLADKKILENFQVYFPSKDEYEEHVSDIVRISGIIDVNAHSLPQKVGGVISTSKCNIYLKTSLLSHCCVPNASWSTGLTSDSVSTLTIRSNVLIKKGSTICVSYNDNELMYGTLRRLIPMEISGLFICRCYRCTDPTELGTNLSAIKCHDCNEGYLFPLDPVDSFSDWKCDNCESVQSDLDVMEIIEDAEEEAGFPKDDFLLVPDENVEFLMEFIDNYSGKILHPNHYVLQEINVRIVTCQQENSLEKLSQAELEVYINRCEDLLRIADILCPGYCEYRAFLLFHLSKGQLLFGKRKFESKESATGWNEELALCHFRHVYLMQEEAMIYLQENYKTHKWLNSLRANIDEVETFINSLSEYIMNCIPNLV